MVIIEKEELRLAVTAIDHFKLYVALIAVRLIFNEYLNEFLKILQPYLLNFKLNQIFGRAWTI